MSGTLTFGTIDVTEGQIVVMVVMLLSSVESFFNMDIWSSSVSLLSEYSLSFDERGMTDPMPIPISNPVCNVSILFKMINFYEFFDVRAVTESWLPSPLFLTPLLL